MKKILSGLISLACITNAHGSSTKETYFISGSAGKFNELRAIIPSIKQTNMDLNEIQEIDAKKVIEAKLQEAFKVLSSRRSKRKRSQDGPTKSSSLFVEDTSLYMGALGGQLPGPLIKWFMVSMKSEGLYKLAQDSQKFDAQAKTYIGYARNPNDITYFCGVIKGTIVAPRGNNGFGWDPIFQPEGSDKTFAQMTTEEKNNFSMRALAAQQLKAEIQQHNS